MNHIDRKEFAQVMKGVYDYYEKDLSTSRLTMWWKAMEGFDLEVIKKALNEHIRTPVKGDFLPRISNMAQILVGTSTDRSLLAWGKVLESMQQVGAYQSVVFDDPAIHAVIEDNGGWPKVCRTELKELSYLQHRFCEAHKAYTGRKVFSFPNMLGGDSDKKRFGFPVVPVLIGDPVVAARIYREGSTGSKTQMTVGAMARSALQIGVTNA